MLKTNSKIVRERIRAYVLENCEDIKESAEYDAICGRLHFTPNTDNVGDILKYVWAVFMDNHGRYIRRGETLQGEFSQFASGLPFNIFDYHYNVKAVDLVGDILEETEAERSKYSENDAERLMDYLIFRECEKKETIPTEAEKAVGIEDNTPSEVCEIILEHIKDLKVDKDTQKKVWLYFSKVKLDAEARRLFG